MRRIEIIAGVIILTFAIIGLVYECNHWHVSQNFVLYFWGSMIPLGFVNTFMRKSVVGKWLNKKLI